MIRCPEVDDQWSLSVSSDLVLVPIQFQFARNLFHLIDQSRLTLGQWLPWVVHVNQCEDLHKLIRYYRNKNKESGAFTCCILSNQAIAGVISINHINREGQSASLGYWLGSGFRSKGVMRRSCQALIHYLFEECGLHKVVIRCAVENVKSQKIPESLGFVKEARLRDGEWLNNRYVDLWSYGMLNWQWENLDHATVSGLKQDAGSENYSGC